MKLKKLNLDSYTNKILNFSKKNSKLIIIITICIIFIVIIFVTNKSLFNIQKITEGFQGICSIQDEGVHYIDCYYKRLTQGIYKDDVIDGGYETETILLPSDKNYNIDDSKIPLMLFYLKYNELFPLIGCGEGWQNNMSGIANSVIDDWAYYMYRIMADPLTKVVDDYSDTSNPFNLKLNSSNYDKIKFFDTSNNIQSLRIALQDKTVDNENYWNIIEKNSFEIHKSLCKIMLITMLSHYIHNDSKKGYNSLYRWGIPNYREHVYEDGILQSKDLTFSSEPFNYHYNIKIDGEYLHFDTSNNNYTFRFFSVGGSDDGFQNVDTNTDKSYLFSLEYNKDCSDYFRIKNVGQNKYLKMDDTGPYTGTTNIDRYLNHTTDKTSATTFFIDYKNIESDMSIDINKILIPYGPNQINNESARTGEGVTILAQSDRDNCFLSYLDKNESEIAVIRRISNPIKTYGASNTIDKDDSIDIKTIGYEFTGINVNNFNKFKFVRQNFVSSKTYFYDEYIQSSIVSGKDIKQDNGGIYGLDSNNNLEDNQITNMNNVETNQTIFPVYNKESGNFQGNLTEKCTYKGKLHSKEAIKNVCEGEPECYGEYESTEDNFKRIYVGKNCDLPIKQVLKTGSSIDAKERKGKLICTNERNDEQIINPLEETNNINICYLPKYTDNIQPGYSLMFEQQGTFPECRENRDFGMLDGPENQMFVNNNKCIGKYTYKGDLLDSGNKQCEKDKTCVFENSITPNTDNYNYLKNTNFTILENQNLELNNKLKELNSKLSTYKENVIEKEELNKKNDEVLVGSLNNFKFIKLNDNINKLNQYAYDQLMSQ